MAVLGASEYATTVPVASRSFKLTENPTHVATRAMTGLAMSAYPVGVGTGVVSGITEIVRYLNSDPIVVQ
jgi:hypothetical protein